MTSGGPTPTERASRGHGEGHRSALSTEPPDTALPLDHVREALKLPTRNRRARDIHELVPLRSGVTLGTAGHPRGPGHGPLEHGLLFLLLPF